MKDKLDINIRIGKVYMTITIDRGEEQFLRDVVKEVNRVYKSYTELFPQSSESEILAKVTMLFAKGYITKSIQIEELGTILENFDSRLDQMLALKQ